MNDNMSEFYEERCAILQFEAGLPKEKAEALAKAEAETYRKQQEAKEVVEIGGRGE